MRNRPPRYGKAAFLSAKTDAAGSAAVPPLFFRFRAPQGAGKTFLTKFSFDATDFKMIQGENKKVGEYEGFYVDEKDLYKTIIDVFYEKVEDVD